jgi:multimeric flavodoxin WrbA
MTGILFFSFFLDFVVTFFQKRATIVVKNKKGVSEMKALIINGSPHKNGTTKRALEEVKKVLAEEGFECTVYDIEPGITGCLACGYCKREGKCVKDDGLNRIAELLGEADALIVGSPVYYASPNGSLISLLDRLFFSTSFDKRMKVGAAVVAARRGGLTASFDVLNKYFSISGMPIATSRYWNQIHGNSAAEAEEDKEGLATMRELGRNIAFLARSIRLGKESEGLPKREERVATNFVR